jgi:Adenylate and Guanylate cyclase catalytic domain/Double zinc ribbon
MRCPSCGSDNRERRKFCAECGAALSLACAVCGANNEPGERFCGECGKPLAGAAKESMQRDPRAYTPKHLAEKILTSRSALEGERKQVTVLFADVKGSMELAEQVDPEEWHKILDRFFQILTDGVHRFEGTVNQYTGDGIMALFGAPIAHEDHAQRACYSALHLRDVLRRYANELRIGKGINFSVRMGLNSGEVVVGKIGDDLREASSRVADQFAILWLATVLDYHLSIAAEFGYIGRIQNFVKGYAPGANATAKRARPSGRGPFDVEPTDEELDEIGFAAAVDGFPKRLGEASA